MEITDDKLKQFFSENKKEIDDFGFTRRVNRRLPDLADRSWIVLLFATVGVVVTALAGYYSGFFVSLFTMLRMVSPYFIPALVFVTTLITGILLLLQQPKSMLR